MYRRCRIVGQETGIEVRTYGATNPDNESNTKTLAWILNVWANGADGVLPWQPLGENKALEMNDHGISGGNALLVPGKRFNLNVVGDMRLKALRDGQQMIEYLCILAQRYNLQREQIKEMIRD